jgi:hypothetical protein
MRNTIDMAREVGAIHIHERPKEFAIVGNDSIKAFEALVRADEREEANRSANASWTLMCEKMVAIEREQCAKVADGYVGADPIADAIRARGETK